MGGLWIFLETGAVASEDRLYRQNSAPQLATTAQETSPSSAITRQEASRLQARLVGSQTATSRNNPGS